MKSNRAPISFGFQAKQFFGLTCLLSLCLVTPASATPSKEALSLPELFYGRESNSTLSPIHVQAQLTTPAHRSTMRLEDSKRIIRAFLQLFPQSYVTHVEYCPLQTSNMDTGHTVAQELALHSAKSIYFGNATANISLLELRIVDEDFPNAFAVAEDGEGKPAVVVLTSGLLATLENTEDLAFALSHEVAHIELDHFVPEFPSFLLTQEQTEHIEKTVRSWELEADRYASTTMERAGYAQNGKQALIELSQWEGTHGGQRLHPSLADRLASLESQTAHFEE